MNILFKNLVAALLAGILMGGVLGVAEFLSESGDLKKGDEILITGPTTGVLELKVHEIQVDHASVERVEKGTRFSIPVPAMIRRSDKLYKIVEASEIKKQ